jgi:4-hydroxybutyrate CoA-transferase
MFRLDGHINYHPAFGMPLSRKINESRLPDFCPLQTNDGGIMYAKLSNVYIAMVAPPNTKGYINLGLTNFYTMEAIRDGRASGKLRVAIGEVNDQMPIIFGDNWLHVSEFDFCGKLNEDSGRRQGRSGR